MLEQVLDDDDLDLSPEVMCLLMRRRLRNFAMSGASGTDDGAQDRLTSPGA